MKGLVSCFDAWQSPSASLSAQSMCVRAARIFSLYLDIGRCLRHQSYEVMNNETTRRSFRGPLFLCMYFPTGHHHYYYYTGNIITRLNLVAIHPDALPGPRTVTSVTGLLLRLVSSTLSANQSNPSA
jgi:hypothetical protein